MAPRMLFNNPFAQSTLEDFLVAPTSQDLEKNPHALINRASSSESSSTLSKPPAIEMIESFRAEFDEKLANGEQVTAYDKKSKIMNKAIQDIGMGRYQYMLFGLCGFGWFADNLWIQAVALTLPGLGAEFGIDENLIRYTTLSLFIGLCIGASFWGVVSDIVGRRLAFNMTLLLAGVFGVAAGSPTTWVGVCALYACIGLGIGGNLPIDGAFLLEFLPGSHKNLLTLLSVWWPLGQLVASLAAWGFFANFGTQQGWRYFIYAMGGLTMVMFIGRLVFIHLLESPKFLLSRGRQREAVTVIHGIAYFNNKTSWLTEDILNAVGGRPEELVDDKPTAMQIAKRNLSKFSGQRIKPLFQNRKTAINTCLIWFIWASIGMGYPLFNAFLPQYLSQNTSSGKENPHAYRDYAITSAIGVPGSIIACYAVGIKSFGRKGTMAVSAALSGLFVILFTIVKGSASQLVMTCLEAFCQNIMYGVLYAYTPEVFPAPNRGTATGISSFLNRFTGLCAPIVAVQAGGVNPKAPIYASAGMFFAAFVAMVALPIETNDKESL